MRITIFERPLGCGGLALACLFCSIKGCRFFGFFEHFIQSLKKQYILLIERRLRIQSFSMIGPRISEKSVPDKLTDKRSLLLGCPFSPLFQLNQFCLCPPGFINPALPIWPCNQSSRAKIHHTAIFKSSLRPPIFRAT